MIASLPHWVPSWRRVMDSKLDQPWAICRALLLAVGGFTWFIQPTASCIYLWGSSNSPKDMSLEIRQRSASILTVLFTGCGNSGKLLNLSELPFLQWQVRDNTLLLVELLWGLTCIIQCFVPAKPSVISSIPKAKLIFIPLLRAFFGLLYS